MLSQALLRVGFRSHLIAFALFFVGVGCTPPSDEVPGLPAVSSINLQDFESVIQEQIRKAFQKVHVNPDDPKANGHLGMILQAYEFYNLAIPCYQRAQHFSRTPFKWLYYEAVSQEAVGDDPRLVVSLYRKAYQLKPDYFPLRLKLAELLLEQGDFEESGQIARQLLVDHSNSARVQYLSGRLKDEMGETEEAIIHFRKACELAPRYGPAHYALGQAYRKISNIEQARAHLSIYEGNQASVPPIEDFLLDSIEGLKIGAFHHVNEGKRLQDLGRIREALHEYQQALQIRPELVQAHVNLISIYGSLGEYDKAVGHYQKAVSIDPNTAAIHYNYGVMLSEQGRHPEAAAVFKKVLEINPFSADAHNNLGYTLQQQGNLKAAEASYRRAISNEPTHREAHFNLGRLLQRKGRHGEAVQQLLEAIQVEDVRTSGFMYYLGDAYARQGNLEKALYYAREARKRAVMYGQRELVNLIDQALQDLEGS